MIIHYKKITDTKSDTGLVTVWHKWE